MQEGLEGSELHTNPEDRINMHHPRCKLDDERRALAHPNADGAECHKRNGSVRNRLVVCPRQVCEVEVLSDDNMWHAVAQRSLQAFCSCDVDSRGASRRALC